MDRRRFAAGCAGAAAMLGPRWLKAGQFPGEGAPLYSPKGAAFVSRGESVAAGGPYTPDWPSLSTYKIPDWYADAKLEWTQTDAGLALTLPATRPCDFAACLEVEGVL